MSDQEKSTFQDSNQQENKGLLKGERTRITIVENDDRSLSIGVHSNEKVTTPFLIGLIEMTKLDLLKMDSSAEDNQVVEITLDELDERMDTMGMLKRQNKKAGDTVQMPVSLIELREASRAAYVQSQTENTPDSAAN